MNTRIQLWIINCSINMHWKILSTFIWGHNWKTLNWESLSPIGPKAIFPTPVMHERRGTKYLWYMASFELLFCITTQSENLSPKNKIWSKEKIIGHWDPCIMHMRNEIPAYIGEELTQFKWHEHEKVWQQTRRALIYWTSYLNHLIYSCLDLDFY